MTRCSVGAGTPQQGGFTGWTMLGVRPDAGRWAEQPEDEWLSVEVQTRVDELAVSAPAGPLGTGEQVTLDSQITQDDTRTFALAWPMSWPWGGSDGVFVGDVTEAPADAVAIRRPVR